MRYTTPRCQMCRQSSNLVLDERKVAAWQAGAHIQNVFPELTAAQRELIMTGTHPGCWDEMWRGLDD